MDSPEYVVQELAFGEMLSAPAQGALGIQMRRGDPDAEKVKAALHCEDTARCVAIERVFEPRWWWMPPPHSERSLNTTTASLK